MASIGFLIGGALINALAFSGSKFLFSSLSKESIDKKQKRHDKAMQREQNGLKKGKNDWITLIMKELKNMRPEKGFQT